MNILVLIGFLFAAMVQGCSQGNSSSMKDSAFTNYVNSNTEKHEVTNQQSNAIVNVAF